MTHVKAFLIFLFAFFLLPLSGQDTDSSVIGRSPYDVADSLMFGWVPAYQHDSIPGYSGNTFFTTDYLPSGSYWDEDCDEEEVYLARMIHKEGDSVHWNLGIGRAGIIFSFIGAYGEGVPPQIHGPGDFNLAPWIDEVWQPVSVNQNLNNNDRIPAPPGSTLATTVRSMPYFIHGAGAYRNDTMYTRLPTPFYSPLMAAWYNEQEKAIYTTNWGTQAHIPSLHKSQALYTYKYKDLGSGIMENTLVIQNFGDLPLTYLNMPWGGVRASNLPQVWFSNPDHSLERSYKTFGGDDPGNVSSLDLTGGYMIWAAEGDNEARPALAIVYGLEKHKQEYASEYGMSFNRIRWGLTGNVERSYTVFVLNPKININRGNSFYYRVYYVNGTFKEVHEKAKRIADAADYGFIFPDPEQAKRTVVRSADHFNALEEDIELFAEPVPDNVPLFLMENTITGNRYISPDLYHDVPTLPFENPYEPGDEKYETYKDRIVYRQYDGTIKYIRMLGYAVRSRDNTPDIRYKLLDSLIIDSTRIIIPEAYKNQVWIPVGSCDNCSVGLDPLPLPAGAVLWSDFGENRNYEVQDPVNLTYEHNLVNPDKSVDNPSHLCGQVIRKEGAWADLKFEVPGSIDLSGGGTFRLRVNHQTELPITDPCDVKMVLRNNGKESTELEIRKYVTVANEWVQYSFNFHNSEPVDQYNQVWIFFSSPDNENNATGQTFLIDELTGPPVIIPEKEYLVSFLVKDLVGDSLLSGIPFSLGQETYLTDKNGEVRFSLTGGNYSFVISHPDYALIQSDLEVRKDTLVELLLTPVKKNVRFSIYSDDMKMVSDVSVIIGEEDEVFSGENGTAIVNLYNGEYEYTLRHPDYFPVDSSLVVGSDTIVQIVLMAKRATVKFRVYSEDTPLKLVNLLIDDESLTTNQVGIALFHNLARFEEYDWNASKEGYESVGGTLNLKKDTTVNLTMSVETHILDPWNHGLSLYPNPAASLLFIESPERIGHIEICDLRGAVLRAKVFNDRNVNVDISGVRQGIYVIRIYRDGCRTVSMKFIKLQ